MTEILYHWFLLLDQFHFCATHITTYQRFVADHSAIGPFLGGSMVNLIENLINEIDQRFSCFNMNTVDQIEVDKNCRRDLLTTSTQIRQEYRINALHIYVD